MSHNDGDYFDGIQLQLDSGKIDKIFTVLLLKYKDELLNLIGDNRKTRNSIGKQITDMYSNIATLGGKGVLQDIPLGKEIIKGVIIEGSDKEYLVEAFSNELDTRKGDTIYQETIVNATSVQVSINFGNKKLLLCVDSIFIAIEDKVNSFQYIQLPHHGKLNQAEKIFEAKKVRIVLLILYLII